MHYHVQPKPHHKAPGGHGAQSSGPRPPDDVIAERERAKGLHLTPNQLVLGDPLPGRSAVDQKRAALGA